MKTVMDAIYEDGALRLTGPLHLPNHTIVRLTIETDGEREAWLKASEEALLKTWDNEADDVFNELRDR